MIQISNKTLSSFLGSLPQKVLRNTPETGRCLGDSYTEDNLKSTNITIS